MKNIINLFIILMMVYSNSIANDMTENEFKNLSTKTEYKGNIRSVIWQPNKILKIKVEYASPTKIVFPAYIEGIDYLEGVGGVFINKKNFSKGQDNILLTRKKDINKDSLVYVTVLGKRMTFLIVYAKEGKGDSLVKIKMSIKNNKVTTTKSKKVYKRIGYKELTKKTNLKSISMLTRIYKGDAIEYYKPVNINKVLKDDNFFSFISNNDKSVGELVFKKLFNGNKDFYTSYNNKTIIPLEMYEDNYAVVRSNRIKQKMDIYGMKMKWCNYTDNAIQINIDDIKSVIGKNILSVKHPMVKTAPKSCDEVIVVFYKKID